MAAAAESTVEWVMTDQIAHADRVKILVCGESGAGKTTLMGTTGEDDSTLIISAEAGLMPLAGRRIRVAGVRNFQGVQSVLNALESRITPEGIVLKGQPIRWVCLDSVSEIAERCLEAARNDPKNKDPRQAYGQLIDQMIPMIKRFRDLPCNVVMSCKLGRDKDDMGRMVKQPIMPGSRLGGELPYLFDEVFVLNVERQGQQSSRWLQTDGDYSVVAKDRSGALAFSEPPDLAAIAAKIRAHLTRPRQEESN